MRHAERWTVAGMVRETNLMLQKMFAGRSGSVMTRRPAEQPRDTRSAELLWLRDLALVLAGLALTLVLTLTAWRHAADNDPILYQSYARAFWTAHPRFAALPREYPPLSVLVFTLTLLPPGIDPRVAFALWSALLFVAGYLAFLRFSGRAAALRYAIYLLVGAQGTLLTRFDLFPALATVGALWAVQRRRFPLAYLLLGIGVALKVYPIFLIPVVAIEQWRVVRTSGPPAHGMRQVVSALRPVAVGIAVCVATILLGLFLPAVRDPRAVAAVTRYALARPVEVESLAGTLVWLGTLLGVPASMRFTFGSNNLFSPLSPVTSALTSLLLPVGCLLLYWWQLRGKVPAGRAFLACLGIVVLTNHVLSAQYVIWLLPVAAAVGGSTPLWVTTWIAIGALTSLEYPILYEIAGWVHSDAYRGWFLLVVALRNALLIVATVLTAVNHPLAWRFGFREQQSTSLEPRARETAP